MVRCVCDLESPVRLVALGLEDFPFFYGTWEKRSGKFNYILVFASQLT